MRSVLEIYAASDGEATKALYARLEGLGAAGVVAMNLFRAQKASARAKVYRGGVPGRGSFRSMAYGRKEWALSNVCAALGQHGVSLGVSWGWQRDDGTPGFAWVLYVDLPTGQVSFHAPQRGTGPDYLGVWDGIVNASVGRILRWCEVVLAGVSGVKATDDGLSIDSHVAVETTKGWRP